MEKVLNDIQIENDYLKKLVNYREYNLLISKYFHDYSLEKNNNKILSNISENVKSCNMIWDVDNFKDLGIKEFKRTFLCKNKFCFNCKKVLQAFRMSKYIPFIKKQSNLYHLVLTVPNVLGAELKDVLKKMAKTFRRFYGIIRGVDKFKTPFEMEIDGAIRSLEITFSDRGFHPHYHVLLSLKSPINLDKTLINRFSYNYSQLSTLFSEQEVYLQRLWYCLYNNINLSKMKEEGIGYSVKLDKFHDEDFCELFKYMCKEKAFVEDGEILLNYEYFKVLYESTYRMKQLQGYGIFFSIGSDDFDYDGISEDYDEFISHLHTLSEVERVREFVSEKDYNRTIKEKFVNDEDIEQFKRVFKIVDFKKFKYISRKQFLRVMKEIMQFENKIDNIENVDTK